MLSPEDELCLTVGLGIVPRGLLDCCLHGAASYRLGGCVIPVFSRVFDLRSAHLLLLPVTFLSLGYYRNGTLTAPYVASLAVGRPDITAKQNLAALLVVVPVSAVAICFFGLSGAGFSWVIYHIFTYSYGLPHICRECLGMPVQVWLRQVLRIMGSAILIYGSAWIVLAELGAFSIIALATAYAAATVVYSVLAFRMMSDELRLKIIEFLNPLRLKGRSRPRFAQPIPLARGPGKA